MRTVKLVQGPGRGAHQHVAVRQQYRAGVAGIIARRKIRTGAPGASRDGVNGGMRDIRGRVVRGAGTKHRGVRAQDARTGFTWRRIGTPGVGDRRIAVIPWQRHWRRSRAGPMAGPRRIGIEIAFGIWLVFHIDREECAIRQQGPAFLGIKVGLARRAEFCPRQCRRIEFRDALGQLVAEQELCRSA